MPRRIGTGRQRKPHFLKEWRKHRELSQERLAERIGTTKATISRIEHGDLPYTQDFLEAAAEALGTEPGNLVMRNPEDGEAPWSLWEQAKPGERKQMIEVMRVIIGGRTGTEG